jgi:hypothetical protein
LVRHRVPDGDVPRYDPTKPIRKQEAPLKPEYQARLEASIRDQDLGGVGLDMAYSCRPPGMPRMMSGIALMEFLISPGVTHILFDRNDYAPRRIYTDGRVWPRIGPDDATFPGYSIGKWIDKDGDGRYDALLIETRHVRNPRTWDQSGMPMADDDEGVIKERLFLDESNPAILHDEMTTIDNSLTRPWTVMKNYRRAPTVWWGENNCIENQAWITIGKEVYYLSGDGTIMPTKKNQPPPDLKYFNQKKQYPLSR